MLKYRCDIRFDKRGIATPDEKKHYKEIALNVVEGVCNNPCANQITSACLEKGIRGIDVNILFTDDASIRQINCEYREIDRSTDVLSFPVNDFIYGVGDVSLLNINEDSLHLQLGDIVVSVPTLKRQSQEYGHSDERDCAFLLCHGMLHLFGYDHMNEEDEEQMFGFADEILNTLHYIREQE